MKVFGKILLGGVIIISVVGILSLIYKCFGWDSIFWLLVLTCFIWASYSLGYIISTELKL